MKRVQIEDLVKVVRGPHKGQSGKVVDLLPEAYKIRLGKESVWFTRAEDFEITKAWKIMLP